MNANPCLDRTRNILASRVGCQYDPAQRTVNRQPWISVRINL